MGHDSITNSVKTQYERLPYPPCDPADESKRLLQIPLDRLPVINQYCFRGARNFDDGFRALVAGGGTGHSTIFLAEQLRGLNAEVHYIDLSPTSLEICKRRSEIRGLDNITFHLGSLLDIESFNLGEFDYINCTGVLHHLEDPDRGLRSLLSVLKSDGAMYLMVYGRYGRAATYMVQDLMRLVNIGVQAPELKLRNLRTVVKSLPEYHWLRFSERAAPSEDASGRLGDAGLYDLYLHDKDRAYTIGELWDWLVVERGLYIPSTPGGPTERILYNADTFISDRTILAQIDSLPVRDRWAAAELIYGQMIMHNLYVCRQPNTSPDIEDETALITPLDDDIERLRAKALAGQEFDLDFKIKHMRIKARTTPVLRTVLKYLDGTRTLAQIFEAAFRELRSPQIPAIRKECLPKLKLMMDLGFFYLRQPHVPIFPKVSALQQRMSGRTC